MYIPHLRQWIIWEVDRTDWPFVPLNYNPQTEEERASLGRLDRYDCETDEEYARRKRMRDHAMRYGQWFLEVPLPDDPERAEYDPVTQQDYLRDRVLDGEWDLISQGGKVRPIAKTAELAIQDFPKNAVLAHVMHRAGLFESVGEARKNGWNKPIAVGLYLVGKDKRRVRVVDRSEPNRFGRAVVYHARFVTGNDLVFSVQEDNDPDPIGDWAIWCRWWNGSEWKTNWRIEDQCRRSEALGKWFHNAILAVVKCPLEVLGKNVRLEDIWIPTVRMDTDFCAGMGRLALKMEASIASIEKRKPRAFLGCAVKYR